MFNPIFQLNYDKIFLEHILSQGTILLFVLFLWSFLKNGSMCRSVYYWFFECGCSSRIICWWQSGVCRNSHYGWVYEFSLPFVAIISGQQPRWCQQSFPQCRLLFYPLLQKLPFCKCGLQCHLKLPDSFETLFHEFLGKTTATFTSGILLSHYRGKSPLSATKTSSLRRFLVWLVEMGTMLTPWEHHLLSPVILPGGSLPGLEQFPHSTH